MNKANKRIKYSRPFGEITLSGNSTTISSSSEIQRNNTARKAHSNPCGMSYRSYFDTPEGLEELKTANPFVYAEIKKGKYGNEANKKEAAALLRKINQKRAAEILREIEERDRKTLEFHKRRNEILYFIKHHT